MFKLALQRARDYLHALWADEESLVEAIVADGWPEEMARAGLTMHRRCWDAEGLSQAVDAELGPVLDSTDHRFVAADRVHHIWPALPGAGLAPVVVGMMLGSSQAVRPSSRGRNFAKTAARHGDFDLLEPDDDWEGADRVVISGGDKTLATVQQKMVGRGEVVGYGHRVSFAVVVDQESSVDLEEAAAKVARDVVMWHQRGCFSALAVLFCGSVSRRRIFCKALAKDIAGLEDRWGTEGITEAQWASRAQALGLAQMKGEVFVEGIGYVRVDDGPFEGSVEAVHSVTVHGIDGAQDIEEAVALPVRQVQGVAIFGAWTEESNRWLGALGATGATRICKAGELQEPPPNWWHDGRPNALSLGRVMTVK